MTTIKLIDVVANLGSYDETLAIYAVKPWSCDSLVIVALEPDEGGLPKEAELCSAEYLIEVLVAKEFLEGWVASEARPMSAREQCERLIHYGIYDA